MLSKEEAACFVGGAAAVALSHWLAGCFRRCVFAPIGDRDTGEQRRRSCPPHKSLSEATMPGSYEAEVLSLSKVKLRNERGFFTLKDGRNIFYQTWLPQDDAGVEGLRAALVMIHGFGDECDFTVAHKAKMLCSLGRFAAVAFDLPGHGRSDGEITYIPDWFAFVDAAREVVVDHVQPLVSRWREAPLPLFGMGESMGGGVLFTMLARERELLAGAVLICPMLYVSEKICPPWIVAQFFKHVLARILPKWPISPGKDLFPQCYSDPAVRAFIKSDASDHRLLDPNSKPRLATACQLVFCAGDWMKQRIPKFDVPCLIIHSEADIVCDPTVSEALFHGMCGGDKELLKPAAEENVWHADLFHGGPKHRDGCRERFAAVVRWLEARSG